MIFLDEPTAGLDPQSRLTTWQVIAGLAASGVTVFLTTQYLEEADRLASQIAVLNGGLVVATSTAAELTRRVAAQQLDLTCSTAGAYEQVSQLLADLVVHLDPAALTVGVATDGSAAQVRAAGRGGPGPGPGSQLRGARRHPRRRLLRPDRLGPAEHGPVPPPHRLSASAAGPVRARPPTECASYPPYPPPAAWASSGTNRVALTVPTPDARS